MIFSDGAIGQMMKGNIYEREIKPEKPWATVGKPARERNILTSLYKTGKNGTA
jgi:hypothetical protein